uniref:Small ribosomal subunit protein uS3m n=1 Tax=Vancouveria planipetala TaxID=304163 RepID=A0A3S8V6J6_9MAGN|nr:ribosomal protein S3 [Vancouveria planipetala]
MGQKINPLGFRLGTSQSHHSLWFEQPKYYFEGLQEDKKIRDYIQNFLQENMRISAGVEGIGRIEIQKGIDLIQVIIYMGFPNLLKEEKSQAIKELQSNVQTICNSLNSLNRKVNIAIIRIKEPYGHPKILAEYLAEQLKNRVPFRKAIQNISPLNFSTIYPMNSISHRKLFWEKFESVPFGYLSVLVWHGLRVTGSRKSQYLHYLNPFLPCLWTRILFVHNQR